MSEQQWRRVHPATPLVRMWLGLVALAVFAINQLDDIVNGEYRDLADLVRSRTAWAVASGVIALILLGLYFSWRNTAYAIDREKLHFKQGVLWRAEKSARIERIEAIDIRRPFAARVLGLCELRVEVAGGEESHFELGFFRLRDGEVLRDKLLAATRSSTEQQSENAVAAAPLDPAEHYHEVLRIPSQRIVLSSLLTFEFIATIVVVIGGIISVVLSSSFLPLATLIALLWGFGGSVFGRLTKNFGYVFQASGRGLRIGRGMFDHTLQSIPVERIHAIEIKQRFLWRAAGWWQVQATVAGYGDAEDETSLLPVASEQEVTAFLAHFSMPWTSPESRFLLHRGMIGSRFDPDDPYGNVPERVRRWDWFSWRRSGLLVDSSGRLWLRQGWWTRKLSVIELSHVQSVKVIQGPIDRRKNVATLQVCLVSGPVTDRIEHVDARHALNVAQSCCI